MMMPYISEVNMMMPVTGRYAHGQFTRRQIARGQIAQNGPPKIRLG